MTDAGLDEIFDTMMEVERNPHGAWEAIQSLCAQLAEVQAKLAVSNEIGLALEEDAGQQRARADRAEAERAAQIEDACAVIDAYSEYDTTLCCNGRECGCQGASVHDVMKHFIRQPHDRTALDRMLAEAREKALREAAHVAVNACLVPPDGGNPTEDERLVCEEAYRRILAMIEWGK